MTNAHLKHGKKGKVRAGERLAQLDEVEVEIVQLVAGGDGLARFEGIPIFVPRSAPGDRARVRLTERRPDFGRAEIVEISPIRDEALPDVDGLYIGGGFPETMAVALSKNRRFIDSLRRAIDAGMPVYAECGGAVFLGEELEYEGETFDMAGVFPVVFTFRQKPAGHGYTKLETVKKNPFFSVGDSLRGHEFHYTTMKSPAAKDLAFAFRVDRGFGFDGEHDGLCTRNVLATYTHVHALGIEGWAPSFVEQAARFKSG